MPNPKVAINTMKKLVDLVGQDWLGQLVLCRDSVEQISEAEGQKSQDLDWNRQIHDGAWDLILQQAK